LNRFSILIAMVRPDEDAFFLQVQVLSGQALEHPVADPSRKERSNRPERGVESPLQAEGKPAGRNESERYCHVIVSAERCLGGPSRSFHGEGNRQQARSRTLAGPLRGCEAAARWNRGMRNRRDPTWQPASGKDRAYKAGRLKSREARRESEGFVVPRKACKTTRWREGALL
jgi:hypothetical protein